MKRKIATYLIPHTLDDIPDIAVFPDEESRHEFEKKEITVVDLSLTYDMYSTHLIEQVPSVLPITVWHVLQCSQSCLHCVLQCVLQCSFYSD